MWRDGYEDSKYLYILPCIIKHWAQEKPSFLPFPFSTLAAVSSSICACQVILLGRPPLLDSTFSGIPRSTSHPDLLLSIISRPPDSGFYVPTTSRALLACSAV